MELYQHSEFRRIDTVNHNNERFADAYADDPAMVETVNELKDVAGEISKVNQKQVRGSKPTTALRDTKEVKLIKKIKKVCGTLRIVADRTGNTDLMVFTNISKSRLKQFKLEDLCSYADAIVKEVEKYSDILIDLGLDFDKQDAFAAQVGDFRTWANSPRDVIATRSAGTKSLPALFARAKELLYRQDGLIEDYEESHPEYYNGFKAAKKLVDPGYRKEEASEEGTADVSEA